jgi:hypothetical protein
MRAQRESATQGILPVNQRNCDGAFVAGSRADTLEHRGRHLLIIAIHHDGFKPSAGQLPDSRVGVKANLDVDFQVAEDSPQHPYDFVVGTQNQQLQTHRGPTP